MDTGRCSRIAGMFLALAATSTSAACRTQVANGDCCGKQIEELRAEVRQLEAKLAGHRPHVPGSADFRQAVVAREKRLNEELDADIKKNGQDDRWAAEIKTRFGFGDKNRVRCGHDVCRIDISFEKYHDASAFAARMLTGCSAVWHGRFAVAKAASLTDEPSRSGPFPFAVFLYKPEQETAPGDVPCDSSDSASEGSAILSAPSNPAPPNSQPPRKTP